MSTPEFTYTVQGYEAIERDHPKFIEQLSLFFQDHISKSSTASVGREDKKCADYFIGTATETEPEIAQTGRLVGAILFSTGKELIVITDQDGEYKPEALSGFIDLIAVEPEHRRKHVATKLLTIAEDTMKERGCVFAQTVPMIADQNQALNFWQSQGYHQEDEGHYSYSKNLKVGDPK